METLPRKDPIGEIRLENDAQSELNNATGLFNLFGIAKSEPGIFKKDVGHLSVSGYAETGLRMVERIVKFSAELNPDILPDLGSLEDAQVQLVDWYRTSVVTRHVAERITKNPGRAWAIENKAHLVSGNRDDVARSVQFGKRNEPVDVGHEGNKPDAVSVNLADTDRVERSAVAPDKGTDRVITGGRGIGVSDAQETNAKYLARRVRPRTVVNVVTVDLETAE